MRQSGGPSSAEYVSIMPTRAVQRAAATERLAEVVTMRRQLCDEHVTIENQAAHVEDWRGLKGTPSRDKTQQNSAANVGCGSAADEIVRPSALAPERGLQSRSIFLAKSGGVTIFRREDR